MSGRVQNGILNNDSSGLTQIKSNVENIRRNYTYPAWFENTLQFAFDGRISERELNNAVDNLSMRGELILSSSPIVRPTMNQSFESLYPTQTQQLIKMGKDTTALGDIVTRQDATDAGFRTELDQALLGREANQSNITTNTGKIENLITEQQNIYDSIGQKADKSHKHAGGGDDCGMFGINCIFQDVGKYAVIAGVGILAFFLLKKRIRL
tara:strand:+ start:557 stop:1186 length:630 start_codon:yes stop_codon:yes gene_type:complete